jgi:hypothetical protein
MHTKLHLSALRHEEGEIAKSALSPDTLLGDFVSLHLFIMGPCCALSCWASYAANKSPPLGSVALIFVISMISMWIRKASTQMKCFPIFKVSWHQAMLGSLMGSFLVAATCVLLAKLARKIPSQEVLVKAANQPRILVIDGFRVFAVSVIMLKHAEVAGTWPVAALRAFAAADASMGGSKPLLFIVSGFIISYVFAQKVEKMDLSTSLSFLARRLGRLAPAYYAALFLGLLHDAVYYSRGPSTNEEIPMIRAQRLAYVVDSSLLQSFAAMPTCQFGSGMVHECCGDLELLLSADIQRD